AFDRRRLAGRGQRVEEGEEEADLVTRRRVVGELLAADLAQQLEGGAGALGEQADDRLAGRRDQLARLFDLARRVAEGAPVAGEAELQAEPFGRGQAGQVFGDRVGAVAVVEVQDDAAEKVVAGDREA